MRAGSHVIDRPPTITATGGGGGGWAWLVTASGIVEAQLIRGVLEGAGVVPIVFDSSDPSPSAWMFLSGNVNAPVRIFVPASLLEDGRLALLETGIGVPEPDAFVPPAGPSARRHPSIVVMVVAALFVVTVAVLVVSVASGTSVSCVLRLVC